MSELLAAIEILTYGEADKLSAVVFELRVPRVLEKITGHKKAPRLPAGCNGRLVMR